MLPELHDDINKIFKVFLLLLVRFLVLFVLKSSDIRDLKTSPSSLFSSAAAAFEKKLAYNLVNCSIRSD